MKRKKTGMRMLLFVLVLWLAGTVTAGAASFSRKAPVVKAKKQAAGVTLKWEKRSDLTGYQVYRTNASGGNKRLQKSTTGRSVTLYQLKRGKTYYYRVRGYKKANGRITYTKFSKVVSVKISRTSQTSTLKKLLATGLQPVGRTMYVWGGGWNKADTGAGDAARRIGVSPKWEAFFRRQTSSYNYQNTRYQIEDGLDCSGYIGWCIYNILNTKDGKPGYVMPAQNMARSFASYGWGTYVPKSQVKDYKAGDIMSSSGHVWMVVGQCGDGSVVLLHSSPPGVQLAGTPASDGSSDSRAAELAEYYMKKYYPQWYAKYPNCAKDAGYLTSYAQMRWDVSGEAVMTDPDHYRDKSADEILEDLFA